MSASQAGPVDYLLLICLSIIWGSAFLLSKIAVAEVPPLTITLIRQAIAILALFGIAIAAGKWFRPTGREHALMLLCALTGTVVPFTLINWGVAVIDSGLAAILMGFMPLVVLLLAHLVTHDEKLSLPKFAGVLLGLVGLAILFWPSLIAGFGEDVVRQVAVLGAAFSYAINALSTKQLIGRPPLPLMAFITAWTMVVLVPAAFAVDDPLSIRPSSDTVFALVALGTMPSVMGTVLMFAIIRRQGATFFGQINLLVPVAGVLLGVILLGERPGLNAYAALAVIFSGVAVARLNPTPSTKIAQGSHP